MELHTYRSILGIGTIKGDAEKRRTEYTRARAAYTAYLNSRLPNGRTALTYGGKPA